VLWACDAKEGTECMKGSPLAAAFWACRATIGAALAAVIQRNQEVFEAASNNLPSAAPTSSLGLSDVLRKKPTNGFYRDITSNARAGFPRPPSPLACGS
jgi:hypothetical protein